MIETEDGKVLVLDPEVSSLAIWRDQKVNPVEIGFLTEYILQNIENEYKILIIASHSLEEAQTTWGAEYKVLGIAVRGANGAIGIGGVAEEK